ncbi:Kinesin protein [Fasciola hepatica]|uniref:Kinesin protein n=1 Tax=Fasciola hepatica TaxID=6192 RepID=A0A4E0S020_FASHE|nr:Kinesin protein [Fasciola hepatica]
MMSVEEGKSLLSFICPRMQSFGTLDGFRLSTVNRNLLDEFEACETKTHSHNELMRVFLRIKPLKFASNNANAEPVLVCSNRHTVVACPPEIQKNLRDTKRTTHSFTFSEIFDCRATQSKLFETVASDQIRCFLEGLNGLIFAYGTTSSGKTYTLQGSSSDLGMIPRAFSMIFSTLRQASNVSLFPKDYSDIAPLSAVEVEQILKEKNTLLRLAGSLNEDSHNFFAKESTNYSENSQDVISRSKVTPAESTPMIPVTDVGKIHYTSELRFTFWISFAEIYNELIFDLLDPTQCVSASNLLHLPNASRGGPTAGVQRNVFSTTNQPTGSFDSSNRLRKKTLDLRTDKNGNIFIKGLRWFPVSSPEEAFRLITVGKQCQKVAATRLNQASSRSHSILTIKAVRVVDKENPRFARISSLTFCDLAGSERTEKAATSGQALRMREAANINTSLLTLGRCIDCLRYNQAHPDNPKLVPYRDSKLTRLFQGFFTGRGKACMIVNASPSPDLFDETLHALRFSALAKQIVVQTNEVPDTIIVDPARKIPAVRGQLHKATLNQRENQIDQPIIRTPATVVPNKKSHRAAADIPSNWSPGGENEDSTTIVEDDLAPDRISNGAQESPNPMASPHTPTGGDETGLILDDYTRDELMFMVRELSEQLFETKGELVEQEARLRQEMCEALNRQQVEFEQLYEDSWNAQEKLMMEKSNRRLQYYADLANKRSGMGKRRRMDDSDMSSDDDLSMNEFVSFHEGDATAQDSHFPLSTMASDIPAVNRLDDARHAVMIHESSQGIRDAQDRIHELEGELADQRDVIENLSKERDQLRMEMTRLEFTYSQLHKQLNAIQTVEKTKPSYSSVAVQTSTPGVAYRHDVPTSPEHANLADSCSVLDDSAVSIHLPKLKIAANLKIGGQKFFDSYVSPEQQLRLNQTTESTSVCSQTPQTVIRLPSRITTGAALEDYHVDHLREENQQLLARLAQMRVCVQRVMDEKKEAEMELTRLQSQSVCIGAGDQSRMSEGLQSFLENESRIQQMETMEQLREQIYELEEQFATKHDALVRTETLLQQMQIENSELSERVLAQADELGRLNQEILDARTQHDTEMKATETKLAQEHEISVARLRQETDATMEVLRQRLMILESHLPDQDEAVQCEPELAVTVDCAMQTAVSPVHRRFSVSQQTSMQTSQHSVGLQVEHSNETEFPNLGSPILPVHQCASAVCIATYSCCKTSPQAEKHDPLLQETIGYEVNRSVATDATLQLSSPVQRNRLVSRKLRLRKGARHDTGSANMQSKRLPKLPSPISGVCISDSESDACKTPCVCGKENRRPTDDEACDADLDEEADDTKSSALRPLRRGTQKERTTVVDDSVTGTGRRTRSTARKTAPGTTGSVQLASGVRGRKAHSAVVSGTRRLPPLAESTQLMPDSFFQDELDRAVDQACEDFQRREEYPAFKQPTTRHHPRRRR